MFQNIRKKDSIKPDIPKLIHPFQLFRITTETILRILNRTVKRLWINFDYKYMTGELRLHITGHPPFRTAEFQYCTSGFYLMH